MASHWLRRQALWLAVLWITLSAVLAIGLLTARQWAGLHLGVVADQIEVLAVDHDSPAEDAGLHAGQRLLAVSSPEGTPSVVLEAADLVENPDLLPSYAAWGRFYDRQTRLSQLWAAPLLRLQVQAAGDGPSTWVDLVPAPARPWRALPLTFWFLLLVPAVSLLAAAWMLVGYPTRTAAAGAVGVALMLSVLMSCVAVVSSRELALPAGLIHGLSVAQHTASVAALLALAGVLAYFPLRLAAVGRGCAGAMVVFFGAWAVANALWWLPSPDWACRAMLLAALAVVLGQALRQWRASAVNLEARAILRAFLLFLVLAFALPLVLHAGVLFSGGTPPVVQNWLYGLILVVAVGAAIGTQGARTLELDDWAMQAVLSLGAGLGSLLCYRLIAATGWLGDDLAMLVAMLVFGITYVPLCMGVWGRRILRRGPTPRELTSGILALGFAPPRERLSHWTNLLAQTLQVRQVEWQLPPAEVQVVMKRPAVMDNGQALWVPPVADLPGVMLRAGDRGGRPFTRNDRRLAQRLSELVAQTIQARDAYVRGAADERERIADDLHDDLGAKLLSLVHASNDSGSTVQTGLAREALEEMRLSVRNLKARPLPMADVLADWRAETVSRLTAAGIESQWHIHLPERESLMPVRTGSQLTRVLREAVSNVIRHSGSRRCRVLIHVTDTALRLEVEDEGRGLDPQAVAAGAGHGLPNIERRVRRLGGTLHFAGGSRGGALLMVRVPLQA